MHVYYFYSLSQLQSICLIRKSDLLVSRFHSLLIPHPHASHGVLLKRGVRLATCSVSGIKINLFNSSHRAVSSSAATLRILGLIPSVSYSVCYYTFY